MYSQTSICVWCYGKGIAIDPADGTVVAPAAGEIPLSSQLDMLSVCTETQLKS